MPNDFYSDVLSNDGSVDCSEYGFAIYSVVFLPSDATEFLNL